MAEVASFTEIYALGQAEVQARGPQWTDFNEGSFLDSTIGGGTTLADEVSRVLVQLFSELFFGTAIGPALDRLAQDRLNLSRKPAASAVATLTWTRVAAGSYTIPLGTTFSASVDGVVYEFVSTSAVLVQAATVTVNVPVRAVATGSDYNVPAGTITRVVSLVGADPTATVTNAQVAAGGAPVESDEVFRARIQQLFFSVRRATVGALRFASLSVPGVAFATVVEDFVTNIVYVYVGDPDAQGNDALVSLVAEELENWRAAGIRVIVLASAAENTALTLEIIIPTGADTTQITNDVRTAIEALGMTLSAGQRAYMTQIECTAFDSNNLVKSANVTTPTGDYIDPALPQNALRFPAGTITLNFIQV